MKYTHKKKKILWIKKQRRFSDKNKYPDKFRYFCPLPASATQRKKKCSCGK